jgi:hypothetical protein
MPPPATGPEAKLESAKDKILVDTQDNSYRHVSSMEWLTD